MFLRLSLPQFIDGVHSSCLARVDRGPFPDDQKQLLRATLQRLSETSSPQDWGQPLGLFYVIYRICGAQADDIALLLGQFSALYIASADLFDDVQDDDLAGKPHEQAGPALATNSALTLLTLALDALGEASEIEQDKQRALAYLRVFNRTSLVAVGAQHRDLLGFRGARTTLEVEEMHRGKTSSLALLCECAAWAGGADAVSAARYYQLGETLAAAVQVIDDVRDLVAKDISVDLATGKSTYPLACFYESVKTAHQRELSELLAQNPIDLDAVRTLLEEHGAFDRCAEAVERHRQAIFELLDQTGSAPGHRRLLIEIVDHLVSALYEPPPRDRAEAPASGAFGQRVHGAALRFAEGARPLGFQSLPQLQGWHLPTFLYVPARETVYFSDVDALPEEIAPFHSQLLAVSPREALEGVTAGLPFVVAHELTHAWRDQLGLLGQDAWHEEYVANLVAFFYVREREPAAARAVVAMCERMLAVAEHADRAGQKALVERASRSSGEASDYECTPEQAAWVHAEMLLQFAEMSGTFEEAARQWLPCQHSFAAE